MKILVVVINVVKVTGLLVVINVMKITSLVGVVKVMKMTGLVVVVNHHSGENNGFGGCGKNDESDGFGG